MDDSQDSLIKQLEEEYDDEIPEYCPECGRSCGMNPYTLAGNGAYEGMCHQTYERLYGKIPGEEHGGMP
jgi:hypothetical protein